MLVNPVYGGRFYALRREGVAPKKRKGESYGKSSSRRRSLEDAIFLSNVVVEKPPLAWDEWLAIQDRLKTNKLQAQRNAKRDYLLRSLIICDTHRRRYHGQPHRGGWHYACPAHYEPGATPCLKLYLPGPELEDKVKAVCREVLGSPDIIEREIHQRAGRVEATLESLQKSLAALDRKQTRNRNTEANLVMERATGEASPEAYERCLALVKAERVWISEEHPRLQAQLETIRQGEATLLGLAQVRETLAAKLDSAANEDWRLVFTALALELHVSERGDIEATLAIPVEQASIVLSSPGVA